MCVHQQENPDVLLHDDWISAVDGSSRIWEAAGVCTHVLEGHSAEVRAVSVVKAAEEEHTDVVFATGARDKTPHAEKLKIGAYRTLRGHTDTVESLAAGPTANTLCSGSWDKSIKLWQTASTKKRKRGNEEEETQSEQEGEAVSTLVGHTQCVSSVVWPEHGTIYSGSNDSSIRRWDLETRQSTLRIVSGKAIYCIDVGGESSTLIAGGGIDPVLNIWDLRQKGTLAPCFRLSSHTFTIATCKWHKSSCFQLLSASFDKKVILWDIRTTHLYLEVRKQCSLSQNSQVLCADWWNGDRVVSGGSDSTLRISS
ncbi:hypothetical protein SSX86_012828 [Deinandra increscens subsp. villosa]|uniref:Uncharacterized protein n=1 Tax=Deinandra increscens subsp. villosa TaxID=3103831 RepID=A0AAP0GZ56_9ASTR